MPKEKSALTSTEPPEETPFYYARVSTRMLKRVEKKRKDLGHNKKVAVEFMMECYLNYKPEYQGD